LSVNNAGLVCAGTNTGELFAWKVDFQRVADRSQLGGRGGTSDLVRHLGQNKLLKNNVGIQFIEFSPSNDHLLLMGSTDGQIKVWNTEITKKGRPEMRTLDLENDEGRLKFTMDEREGCI
jgi:WD40 repeat protein